MADARVDWPGVAIIEDSAARENSAIRTAEVPVFLIDQVAARFDAVVKEMKAAAPGVRKIGQLLGQAGERAREAKGA